MAAGSSRTLERRQPVLTGFQLQISRDMSLKRSTLDDYFFNIFNLIMLVLFEEEWLERLSCFFS